MIRRCSSWHMRPDITGVSWELLETRLCEIGRSPAYMQLSGSPVTHFCPPSRRLKSARGRNYLMSWQPLTRPLPGRTPSPMTMRPASKYLKSARDQLETLDLSAEDRKAYLGQIDESGKLTA
jgi:hypothetical protein